MQYLHVMDFLLKWLMMFCILHVYLSIHRQAGICNATAIFAEEIVQNVSGIVEHLHSLMAFGTTLFSDVQVWDKRGDGENVELVFKVYKMKMWVEFCI